MEFFQYLSLVRFKGLIPLLKNYSNKNVSIILDLEDSAQDLFSRKRTENLKRICQKGLIHIARKKINVKNKIFIRINKVDTKVFDEDIKAIKASVRYGLKIEGIFVPKIDNFSQLNKVYNILKKNCSIKLVPIIETKRGLKNLESIIKKDKNRIISYVHYGHFDYCLDQNLWPFPEPYHREYWKIISHIVQVLKSYEYKFVQTPFPLIKNYSIYWSSVKYLKEILKVSKFGMSLVSYDEKFFIKPKKIKKLKIKSISKNNNFKIKFAKKICKEYILNKSFKKSFSLSKKRFIAPHQYLAAKQFLKSNNL